MKMKKKVIAIAILIIVFGISFHSFSQSTITLRNGETHKVIVNYSTENKLSYTIIGDSSNKQYLIDKSEIWEINYKSSQSSMLPVDEKTRLVTFKNIVEVKGLTAGELYNLAKEWMSNEQLFNVDAGTKGMGAMEAFVGTSRGNFAVIDNTYRIKDVITLEDKELKKLIGGFSMRYFGSSLGCVRVVYVNGDIKLYFKDGRYKIEATNMSYAHYNQTSGRAAPFMTINDKGDCASKNPIESMLICTKCKREKIKLYTFLTEEITGLIENLEKFINLKKDESDDW